MLTKLRGVARTRTSMGAGQYSFIPDSYCYVPANQSLFSMDTWLTLKCCQLPFVNQRVNSQTPGSIPGMSLNIITITHSIFLFFSKHKWHNINSRWQLEVYANNQNGIWTVLLIKFWHNLHMILTHHSCKEIDGHITHCTYIPWVADWN